MGGAFVNDEKRNEYVFSLSHLDRHSLFSSDHHFWRVKRNKKCYIRGSWLLPSLTSLTIQIRERVLPIRFFSFLLKIPHPKGYVVNFTVHHSLICHLMKILSMNDLPLERRSYLLLHPVNSRPILYPYLASNGASPFAFGLKLLVSVVESWFWSFLSCAFNMWTATSPPRSDVPHIALVVSCLVTPTKWSPSCRTLALPS